MDFCRSSFLLLPVRLLARAIKVSNEELKINNYIIIDFIY